jgi:hypothetical protein
MLLRTILEAVGRCFLCNKPAQYEGLFFPPRAQAARYGGTCLPYALCARCNRRPASAVEQELARRAAAGRN